MIKQAAEFCAAMPSDGQEMFVDRKYDSSEHIGFAGATRTMQEDSSNHVLSTSQRSRVEKAIRRVNTFQTTTSSKNKNSIW